MCLAKNEAVTPTAVVMSSPTAAPTGTVPESLWPNSTLASCSEATLEEVRYCYETHDGVCVSNATECEALDGVFHDGVGCGGPSGSGCSCCKNTFLTVAPTGGPPAPDPTTVPAPDPTTVPAPDPTTAAPTTAIPDALWPENLLATCDAAETHEVQYCYQHHDGVCVSNATECEALDGSYHGGVGCGGPPGSGCSCCRGAYATWAPSGAPEAPTGTPTTAVPETLWPENLLATCETATYDEVRYCYQRHDGGVCVANASECDAIGGRKYAAGVGCGGPGGSGCSCCKGPRSTASPTPVPPSAQKKSSSSQIPVLYLALFALVIFLLAYCCGVLTSVARRRRDKRRNIEKYRPRKQAADGGDDDEAPPPEDDVSDAVAVRMEHMARPGVYADEDFDGSAEAVAARLERLGPRGLLIADRVREHQIDCVFLRSLDDAALGETLEDLGCNGRLFRRRVAFELRQATTEFQRLARDAEAKRQALLDNPPPSPARSPRQGRTRTL